MALQETHSQISQIREGVAKNLGQKEAGIFDAHLLVLEDKAFIDDIELELGKSEDKRAVSSSSFGTLLGIFW